MYSNTLGQSSIQHATLNQLNITKQTSLNIYHFPSKLVLLKYQDSYKEYAIFESYLSWNLLVSAQNFSTIQMDCEFQYYFPIQTSPVLELQVCSYCLNIGQEQLNITLTM